MRIAPLAAAVVMTMAGLITTGRAASFYWDRFPKSQHPPNYIKPLQTMSFEWNIIWSNNNQTAHMVGTFNYTGDVWVGVGTKSASGMDGLNIICYIDPSNGVPFCNDWWGAGYDIDKISPDLCVTLGGALEQPTNTVSFSRVVYDNGADLGVVTWGTFERVIWGWGPGAEGEHPGEGIQASLTNFRDMKTIAPANPGAHRLAVWATLAFTLIVVIIVQVHIHAGIRVHHYVRDIFGYFVALVYFGLWWFYVLLNTKDYKDMGLLGPMQRAMGDGAAAALGALLITASRRVFMQDLLSVSHERSIFYHTVLGLAFGLGTVWHILGMVEMYFWPYMFLWHSWMRVPTLPAFIGFILFLLVIAPAVFRFHISYRIFRLTHFLWLPAIVMTIFHFPNLAFAVLPGFAIIFFSFVWGFACNVASRVETITLDKPSDTVTVVISRPYKRFIGTGEARDTIGLAPAQWFYLKSYGVSLAWHPFSAARAEIVTDADTGAMRQHITFVIKTTHGLAGGGGPIKSLMNAVFTATGTIEHVNKARAWGSWTTNLYDRVAQAPQQPVGGARDEVGMSMEGPYGRLQLPVHHYTNIMLVAGGIGVTPHLLTLQNLAAMAASKQYFWRHVTLVWVCRDATLLPLFSKDIATDRKALAMMGVACSIRLFITSQQKNDVEQNASYTEIDGVEVIYGRRPDISEEIQGSVFNEEPQFRDTALYVCGPLPMIKSCYGAASDAAGALGTKVHVHDEVFDV